MEDKGKEEEEGLINGNMISTALFYDGDDFFWVLSPCE